MQATIHAVGATRTCLECLLHEHEHAHKFVPKSVSALQLTCKHAAQAPHVQGVVVVLQVHEELWALEVA